MVATYAIKLRVHVVLAMRALYGAQPATRTKAQRRKGQ